MKHSSRIIALLLLAALMSSIVAGGAIAAPATRAVVQTQKVSDPVSYNLTQDATQVSTKYNGSMWADKSVSATMGIYPDLIDYTLGDDELEVSLSAISQAFPVTTVTETIVKRANIVFAIDVSTSMTSNYLPVNGASKTRMQVLKQVAANFVDTLDALNVDENGIRTDEYEINISIVLYAGQAFAYQKWVPLNATTTQTLKSKIERIEIPTAKTCTGATNNGNTNTQVGAFMSRLMYADTYAEELNRPTNYNEKSTNNFVIFMTDGAPNRYYAVPSVGEPGSTTDAMADSIPVGYDSGHDIYYTMYTNYNSNTKTGMTRQVTSSTDYKKMAAYTALQQIEEMKKINNCTVFSLGLGEWFVDDGEVSGFPTATNLCQLVAAVGNGTRDPSNGHVITADYCWNNYLGYDVADGTMCGANPVFPLDENTSETIRSRFFDGTYYYFSKDKDKTKYYFNSWQAMLDAANMPNPTDTFIDAKTGATITKRTCFISVVVRDVDANFTTFAECGIPYVPEDVLSQVVYYYAGNTAEKFSSSMQDIITAIATSFGNHVTAITNYGDPLIDGLVKFVDTIGEGMEVRKFLGVVFNNTYFSGASQAQFFANYDSHEWEPADLAKFETWCGQMQYVYGVPINRAAIEMLIRTSVAGGDIYYNSPTDYSCQFAIYGKYIAGADAYQYAGPYYNLDGSVAPVPTGATHIVHQYLVSGMADSSVLIDEDVSLLYLQMAHAINLTTGQESVIMNVPAALIPVRTIVVTDGVARPLTDPMPLSMIYTVGLQDDLNTDILAANASTDAQGNTVHTFYTNAWKDTAALAQSDLGTTYAHFVASPLNPYYHAVTDELLYVADAAAPGGYRAAVQGDTGTFYVYTAYSDNTGTSQIYQPASDYYDVNEAELITVEGVTNYYIPDGTLRQDETLETARLKTSLSAEGNVTQTNPNFYDSTFSKDEKSYTAVRTHLGNNGKLVVAETEIEDYVVVDYGLPVEVEMDGFDTLTVASDPKITVVGATAAGVNAQSAALNYGTLSIENNTLRYTPNSTNFDAVDTGYFLCAANVEGTTTICRGTLHIIPATNVTYEESFLNFTDAAGAAWSTEGTAANAVQSSENSHYGYDAAYAANADTLDSLGCSRVATVSDPMVQPTATFTFTGTGFDIISRTAADCGVMLIEVRADDAAGQLQKVLIVDNYLNADTLYQLPVVHQMFDTYGTYFVKITAYYNRAFDHTLRVGTPNLELIRKQLGYAEDVVIEYHRATGNIPTRTPATAVMGQYNVYVDGIRVYNPLGTELSQADGIAYTAYAEAGELNPTYVQVRDSLLSAANWTGDGSTGAVASVGDENYNPETDGAVYIAGNDTTVSGPGQAISRPGIYLSSSGQLKMNENGELLNANDEVIKLTVAINRYSVYYYNGEITETEQEDGSMRYTDDEDNEIIASRLFYLRSGKRVFLNALQENSLNICYYDDAYDADSAENEVYLKNGQAIAFTVVSGSHVQISIKSPNGLPVQLCVYDVVNEQWVQLGAVSGSMEQYYDASAYIQDGACILKCAAQDATAILSIVNVKITNDDGLPSRMTSTPGLVYHSTQALANSAVAQPVQEHVHSYTVQPGTAPTCTEDGAEQMVCECGDSYEVVLPAAGHTMVYEQTQSATCTQRGEIVGTCSVCGETTTQSFSAIGHDFEVTVLNDADSTRDAVIQYTCVNCGVQFTLPGEESYGKDCAAYTDIPDNWAREGIAYIISKGLLTGTTKTTFSPDAPMTRAMLVTALYRLAGEPGRTDWHPFVDVPLDAFYSDSVSWAYDQGIVKGMNSSCFEPLQTVTREQLAVMLYRCSISMGYGTNGETSLDAFADAGEVSEWSTDAMRWAVGNGIILGTSEYTVSPQQTATRAQTATMLMRFVRNIINR